MSHIISFHHTATITLPPDVQGFNQADSMVRFLLSQATAERSERYISSLERTDLGVPLEVEFEETPSVEALGDTIDRSVSAPGAEYNIKIWSINGASFSRDPLVAATNLLFDTGTETTNMDIRSILYISLGLCVCRFILHYYCTLLCTAPSVPRLLSVTRILSDGFELNWLPPREPNGTPQYEIEYGTDDTNFTTVDTGSENTYYNLTGLLQSTTYYIRVLAVNYFTSDGLPLRGNESETVSGIIIPEPGEDAH